MIRNLLKSSLIVSLIIIVLTGCHQNPSSSQGKGIVAGSIDSLAFRNKMVELIQKSPKGIKTYELLKEIGASYINGLTLPLSNADKYETKQEMALAVGAYGADINYSSISQHPDLAIQGGQVITNLVGKLGIQNNMPNTLKNLDSLRKYADNKDSVAAYAMYATTSYHQVQSANSPEIYPLIFIGANIETFYLLTQLTLFSSTNPAMLECISKQGDLAKTVLDLLEILSADETIKPYYEKMKPIVAFFNDHPSFTLQDLKAVAPLIDAIRSDMLL
jgi:hypothetical protein